MKIIITENQYIKLFEHKDYKLFSLTEKQIKNMDKELLMKILYKHRNKNIGPLLYKIINRFTGNYKTPKEWFENKEYKTFMEYFKRKISKQKMFEIKKQTKNEMSLPCECVIESKGNLNALSSIVRLKKPTKDVISDLKKLKVENVENLSFINMKLLKIFYHRIHSPISGKISKIIEVSPKDNFFGENNLWILEIKNKTYGNVYLILVGELSIQDFTFKVDVGDQVKMFEEIGNFNWASQVLILFDKDKFDKEVKLKKNGKYFMGDPVF